MADIEHLNQIQYQILKQNFVQLEHLYVRLPNGNVTTFDNDKKYIINAIDIDYEDKDTLYFTDFEAGIGNTLTATTAFFPNPQYPNDPTRTISGYVFGVYNLSERLTHDETISIIPNDAGITNITVNNIFSRLKGDNGITLSALTGGNAGITKISISHNDTLSSTKDSIFVWDIYSRLSAGSGINLIPNNETGVTTISSITHTSQLINDAGFIKDDEFLSQASYVTGIYVNGKTYEYVNNGYYASGIVNTSDSNYDKLTSNIPSNTSAANRYLKLVFTKEIWDDPQQRTNFPPIYIDITELFRGFTASYNVNLTVDNKIRAIDTTYSVATNKGNSLIFTNKDLYTDADKKQFYPHQTIQINTAWLSGTGGTSKGPSGGYLAIRAALTSLLSATSGDTSWKGFNTTTISNSSLLLIKSGDNYNYGVNDIWLSGGVSYNGYKDIRAAVTGLLGTASGNTTYKGFDSDSMVLTTDGNGNYSYGVDIDWLSTSNKTGHNAITAAIWNWNPYRFDSNSLNTDITNYYKTISVKPSWISSYTENGYKAIRAALTSLLSSSYDSDLSGFNSDSISFNTIYDDEDNLLGYKLEVNSDYLTSAISDGATYTADENTLHLNNKKFSIKNLSARLTAGDGIVYTFGTGDAAKTTITAPSGSSSINLNSFQDEEDTITGWNYTVNPTWLSSYSQDGYLAIRATLTGLLGHTKDDSNWKGFESDSIKFVEYYNKVDPEDSSTWVVTGYALEVDPSWVGGEIADGATYSADENTLHLNNEKKFSIKNLSARLIAGNGIVYTFGTGNEAKTTITAPSGSNSIDLSTYYDLTDIDNPIITGYDYNVNTTWLSGKVDEYETKYYADNDILTCSLIDSKNTFTVIPATTSGLVLKTLSSAERGLYAVWAPEGVSMDDFDAVTYHDGRFIHIDENNKIHLTLSADEDTLTIDETLSTISINPAKVNNKILRTVYKEINSETHESGYVVQWTDEKSYTGDSKYIFVNENQKIISTNLHGDETTIHIDEFGKIVCTVDPGGARDGNNTYVNGDNSLIFTQPNETLEKYDVVSTVVNKDWLSGYSTTGVSAGLKTIMEGIISTAVSINNNLIVNVLTTENNIVTGYSLDINPDWLSTSTSGGYQIITGITSEYLSSQAGIDQIYNLLSGINVDINTTTINNIPKITLSANAYSGDGRLIQLTGNNQFTILSTNKPGYVIKNVYEEINSETHESGYVVKWAQEGVTLDDLTDSTYTGGRFITVSATKDVNGDYPISCTLSGDDITITIDEDTKKISVASGTEVGMILSTTNNGAQWIQNPGYLTSWTEMSANLVVNQGGDGVVTNESSTTTQSTYIRLIEGYGTKVARDTKIRLNGAGSVSVKNDYNSVNSQNVITINGIDTTYTLTSEENKDNGEVELILNGTDGNNSNVSISGTGGATVTTDEDGNIIVNSDKGALYNLSTNISTTEQDTKIILYQNNLSTDFVVIEGSGATRVKSQNGKIIISTAVEGKDVTNFVTHLYAGTSGTEYSQQTSNGSTYLKIFDDSEIRSNLAISGAGTVSVSSDSNGYITISGTDTNTLYDLYTNTTDNNGEVKLTLIDSDNVPRDIIISGSGKTTVTSQNNKIIINSIDQNDHYKANLRVNDVDTTTNISKTVPVTSSVYIRLYEDDVERTDKIILSGDNINVSNTYDSINKINTITLSGKSGDLYYADQNILHLDPATNTFSLNAADEDGLVIKTRYKEINPETHESGYVVQWDYDVRGIDGNDYYSGKFIEVDNSNHINLQVEGDEVLTHISGNTGNTKGIIQILSGNVGDILSTTSNGVQWTANPGYITGYTQMSSSLRVNQGTTTENKSENSTTAQSTFIRLYEGDAYTNDSILLSGEGGITIHNEYDSDNKRNTIVISGSYDDNNTTYSLASNKNADNDTTKITLSGSDGKTDDVFFSGSGITTVSTDENGKVIIFSPDTNTHNTAYIRVNNGDENTIIDEDTDNTSTYIALVDGEVNTSRFNLSGINIDINFDSTNKVLSLSGSNGALYSLSTNSTNDFEKIAKVLHIKNNIVDENDYITFEGYGATYVKSEGKRIIISSALEDAGANNWKTHLYVGQSGIIGDQETNNGSSYLKLFDDDMIRANLAISGAGTVKVSSDANGYVTISGMNTNTIYQLSTNTADTNGQAKLYLVDDNNDTNDETNSISIIGTGYTTVTTQNGIIYINSTDQDTHYTSYLNIGTSGSLTNTSTNFSQDTYLKITDGEVNTSNILLSGIGVVFNSDQNGILTLSSSNGALYNLSSSLESDNKAKITLKDSNNHTDNVYLIGGGGTTVSKDDDGNITINSYAYDPLTDMYWIDQPREDNNNITFDMENRRRYFIQSNTPLSTMSDNLDTFKLPGGDNEYHRVSVITYNRNIKVIPNKGGNTNYPITIGSPVLSSTKNIMWDPEQLQQGKYVQLNVITPIMLASTVSAVYTSPFSQTRFFYNKNSTHKGWAAEKSNYKLLAGDGILLDYNYDDNYVVIASRPPAAGINTYLSLQVAPKPEPTPSRGATKGGAKAPETTPELQAYGYKINFPILGNNYNTLIDVDQTPYSGWFYDKASESFIESSLPGKKIESLILPSGRYTEIVDSDITSTVLIDGVATPITYKQIDCTLSGDTNVITISGNQICIKDTPQTGKYVLSVEDGNAVWVEVDQCDEDNQMVYKGDNISIIDTTTENTTTLSINLPYFEEPGNDGYYAVNQDMVTILGGDPYDDKVRGLASDSMQLTQLPATRGTKSANIKYSYGVNPLWLSTSGQNGYSAVYTAIAQMLKKDGHIDINCDPNTETITISGGGTDKDDWYRYTSGDSSLIFTPGGGANSTLTGDTSIIINKEWLSSSNYEGYNAIYAAMTGILSSGGNAIDIIPYDNDKIILLSSNHFNTHLYAGSGNIIGNNTIPVSAGNGLAYLKLFDDNNYRNRIGIKGKQGLIDVRSEVISDEGNIIVDIHPTNASDYVLKTLSALNPDFDENEPESTTNPRYLYHVEWAPEGVSQEMLEGLTYNDGRFIDVDGRVINCTLSADDKTITIQSDNKQTYGIIKIQPSNNDGQILSTTTVTITNENNEEIQILSAGWVTPNYLTTHQDLLTNRIWATSANNLVTNKPFKDPYITLSEGTTANNQIVKNYIRLSGVGVEVSATTDGTIRISGMTNTDTKYKITTNGNEKNNGEVHVELSASNNTLSSYIPLSGDGTYVKVTTDSNGNIKIDGTHSHTITHNDKLIVGNSNSTTNAVTDWNTSGATYLINTDANLTSKIALSGINIQFKSLDGDVGTLVLSSSNGALYNLSSSLESDNKAKITLKDSNNHTDNVYLVGGGGTTVSKDDDGNITINSYAYDPLTDMYWIDQPMEDNNNTTFEMDNRRRYFIQSNTPFPTISDSIDTFELPGGDNEYHRVSVITYNRIITVTPDSGGNTNYPIYIASPILSNIPVKIGNNSLGNIWGTVPSTVVKEVTSYTLSPFTETRFFYNKQTNNKNWIAEPSNFRLSANEGIYLDYSWDNNVVTISKTPIKNGINTQISRSVKQRSVPKENTRSNTKGTKAQIEDDILQVVDGDVVNIPIMNSNYITLIDVNQTPYSGWFYDTILSAYTLSSLSGKKIESLILPSGRYTEIVDSDITSTVYIDGVATPITYKQIDCTLSGDTNVITISGNQICIKDTPQTGKYVLSVEDGNAVWVEVDQCDDEEEIVYVGDKDSIIETPNGNTNTFSVDSDWISEPGRNGYYALRLGLIELLGGDSYDNVVKGLSNDSMQLQKLPATRKASSEDKYSYGVDPAWLSTSTRDGFTAIYNALTQIIVRDDTNSHAGFTIEPDNNNHTITFKDTGDGTSNDYSAGKYISITTTPDANDKYPINLELSGDGTVTFISGSSNNTSGKIILSSSTSGQILSTNSNKQAVWVTPPTNWKNEDHYSAYLRVNYNGTDTTSNSNTDTYKDVYIVLNENSVNRDDKIKLVGTSNINISNTYDSDNKVNTITFTGPNLDNYLTDQDETHLIVTSGNNLTNSFITSNSATFINLTEGKDSNNQTVRNSIQISGAGNINVYSDNDGFIIISGNDKDTHYTSYLNIGTSGSLTNTSTNFNQDTYLKITDGNKNTSNILLSGIGITFNSDQNGILTLSSSEGALYKDGRFIDVKDDNTINSTLSGDNRTINISGVAANDFTKGIIEIKPGADGEILSTTVVGTGANAKLCAVWQAPDFLNGYDQMSSFLVAASGSTLTSNTSATNADTYLILTEGKDSQTARSAIKITGAGGTSVSTNDGNITINSYAYDPLTDMYWIDQPREDNNNTTFDMENRRRYFIQSNTPLSTINQTTPDVAYLPGGDNETHRVSVITYNRLVDVQADPRGNTNYPLTIASPVLSSKVQYLNSNFPSQATITPIIVMSSTTEAIRTSPFTQTRFFYNKDSTNKGWVAERSNYKLLAGNGIFLDYDWKDNYVRISNSTVNAGYNIYKSLIVEPNTVTERPTGAKKSRGSVTLTSGNAYVKGYELNFPFVGNEYNVLVDVDEIEQMTGWFYNNETGEYYTSGLPGKKIESLILPSGRYTEIVDSDITSTVLIDGVATPITYKQIDCTLSGDTNVITISGNQICIKDTPQTGKYVLSVEDGNAVWVDVTNNNNTLFKFNFAPNYLKAGFGQSSDPGLLYTGLGNTYMLPIAKGKKIKYEYFGDGHVKAKWLPCEGGNANAFEVTADYNTNNTTEDGWVRLTIIDGKYESSCLKLWVKDGTSESSLPLHKSHYIEPSFYHDFLSGNGTMSANNNTKYILASSGDVDFNGAATIGNKFGVYTGAFSANVLNHYVPQHSYIEMYYAIPPVGGNPKWNVAEFTDYTTINLSSVPNAENGSASFKLLNHDEVIDNYIISGINGTKVTSDDVGNILIEGGGGGDSWTNYWITTSTNTTQTISGGYRYICWTDATLQNPTDIVDGTRMAVFTKESTASVPGWGTIPSGTYVEFEYTAVSNNTLTWKCVVSAQVRDENYISSGVVTSHETNQVEFDLYHKNISQENLRGYVSFRGAGGTTVSRDGNTVVISSDNNGSSPSIEGGLGVPNYSDLISSKTNVYPNGVHTSGPGWMRVSKKGADSNCLTMYIDGNGICLGTGNFTGIYAIPGGVDVTFSNGSSQSEVFAAYTGSIGGNLGTPVYSNLYASTSMQLNTQYIASSDGWVRISLRSVSSCPTFCVNGYQIELGAGNYTGLFPIAAGDCFGVLGTGDIFFKFDGSASELSD